MGPYLFTGRKGPLQKRRVQKLFNDYAEAAGIKETVIEPPADFQREVYRDFAELVMPAFR